MALGANIRDGKKGMALILVLGFILILGGVVVAFITLTNNEVEMARREGDSLRAFYLAEAGVEKTIYELTKDADYAGESGVSLGAGIYDVGISPIPDTSNKQITATGYVPDKASPRATRQILVEARRKTQAADVDGAVTSYGSIAVTGSAEVDGGNEAGISYSGSCYIQKSGSVTGNPPTSPGAPAPTFENVFGMSKAEMKALATVYNSPPTNTPNPANGIIWIDGMAQFASSGWQGDGILVVIGSLTLTGGEYRGVIYVEGALSMAGNANIEGGLLVVGSAAITGNATVEYSEDAIEGASQYFPYDVVKWQEVK